MKKILLLILTATITLIAYSQNTENDADDLFEEENYPVALKIYEKLYKKDSQNVYMNYKMGVCYLNCNANPKAALKHLIKAEKEKKQDDYVYYFELAWAYLNNEKFDKALETLQKSKNLAVKNADFRLMIDQWIAYAENAKKYYKKPINVSFVNLGKYINSPMDEITPIITADGEMLLFTTNLKLDRAYNIYTYDIYYSMLSKKSFQKKRSLTNFNTVEDEYIAGVSASGDQIFAQLQAYEAFEDLAVITRDGKRLGRKELLKGEVNTKKAEYAASTSISGDTLFFSSARDGGKGGMDIYMSRKLPNGEWAKPNNLGNKINTIYDEDFPMMSPDNKTLYFCSNGKKSMGGFDVFKTKLLPNGEWTEPQNIGYPLNDVFDNKTIAFSPNKRYAYVSKRRDDTYGFNDLYRVIYNDKDPSVKILILKIKIGDKKQSVDFAQTDTTLKVVSKKDKTIFGKYAYQSTNSQVTIALPPGSYNIELVGKQTEKYNFKLSIDDAPNKSKIIKKTVFLKPKN